MSHRKNHFASFMDAVSSKIGSHNTVRKPAESEFIRDKAKEYVLRKKQSSYAECLKKGYESMAEINLEIAELCLEADNIQQQSYEEKLAECE